MPDYEVQDAQGRKLIMSGDTPPTEADIDAAFKASFPESAAPSPPPKSPAPFNGLGSKLTEAAGRLVQASPIGQTAAMGDALLSPKTAVKSALQGNQDLFTQASDAFHKGDYGHAAVKGLYYLLNGVPGLGSALSEAGDQAEQGNYLNSAATAVGLGTSLAAPKYAPKATSAVADAMNAREAARTTAKATAAETASVGNVGALQVDLVKAIPPSNAAPYSPLDVKRAAPYLKDVQKTAPIRSIENYRDGLDAGIRNVEQGRVQPAIEKVKDGYIESNPWDAAQAALTRTVRRPADLAAGMKALEGLGLDKMMKVGPADQTLKLLNAELEADLARNQYDRALARRADPVFAAKEAAASSLRDGLYGRLETSGALPNARELRRDIGSMIQLRDAAQRRIFNGDQSVAGTGAMTMRGKLTRTIVPAVGAGVGGAIGGPYVGAPAGALIGNELAKSLAPPNLTRDALIERAFSKAFGDSQ